MKNKKEPVPAPKEQTRPEREPEAAEEEDEYAGYTRENPPPWLDEFEYIDFMMTH